MLRLAPLSSNSKVREFTVTISFPETEKSATGTFLLDSGSTLSFISPDLVNELGLTVHEISAPRQIEDAAGNMLCQVDKYVTTTINIKDTVSLENYDLYLVPSTAQFDHQNILGMDIFDTVTNMGLNIIHLTDNSRFNPKRNLLYTKESTTLLPNSEEAIMVETQGTKIIDKYIVTEGPQTKPGAPLVIPDGITFAENPVVYIVNNSHHPITIEAGEAIAAFKPAGNIITKNTESERLRLITHVSELKHERKTHILEKIKKWEDDRKPKLKDFTIKESMVDVGKCADAKTKELLIKILNNRKGSFAMDKTEQGMSFYEYQMEFKVNEANEQIWPKLSDFWVRNYKHNLIQSQYIDEEIEKLLQAGTISYTSSNANLPTILILKITPEKKTKARLCIDFTKLNKFVQVRNWSVPNCPQVLDTLSQAIANSRKQGLKVMFCMTDVKAAFQSIHLEPKSKMYTAFSHRDKSYAFENLPFGLASSPASFTECVNRIMVDILTKYKKNITIYIDDILIWGTSTSLILKILDEVLERLEAEHLLLNLEKSTFFVDEVNFLGKIINNDGIKPTEKSLMEIFNFDLPFTMKNTQKLLGHANFLLDHLPRFRVVAQPLYDLISRLIKSEAKPSQKITLTETEKTAWENIKNLAKSAVQLDHLDYFGPMYVTADACATHVGYCMGNIVEQANGENHHTVCKVGSFAMHKALQNSCSKIHEAFGLLNALKIMQRVLQGSEVTLYSDNKAAVNLIQKGQFNASDCPRPLKYLFPYTLNMCLTVKYLSAQSPMISFADAISRNIIRVEKLRICRNFQTINIMADLNRDKITQIQKTDEWCQSLETKRKQNGIAKINGKAVVKRDETLFVVRNGIECILIPEKLADEILDVIHLSSIHGSIEVMARLLQKEKIYINRQNQKLQQIVDTCLTCQLHARVNAPKKVFAFNLKPTANFERLHMDLFVLAYSNGPYRFGLLIIDAFSGHLAGYLIKTKASTEVAAKVRSYCMTYNVNSATFTSDNGREFANTDMQDVLTQFGCNQMFSAAINPTANGIIEAVVGSVKRKLRTMDTTEETLVNNFELVIYNHNSTPGKNRMNFTPFEISTGRRNLSLLTLDDSSLDTLTSVDDAYRQMQMIQYQVAEHVTNTMRTELFSVTKRPNQTFRRLDFVLILGPPKPKFLVKSNLAWHGPMIVTSLFGRNGVKVRDIYSGRSYKRNTKYVKLLNLSNSLKRTIKEQLLQFKTGSLDPDTLEEIITRKLQEREELDNQLQVEIKTLTAPARPLEDEITNSPRQETETYKEAENEPKSQKGKIDDNRYNLRQRNRVNYKL